MLTKKGPASDLKTETKIGRVRATVKTPGSPPYAPGEDLFSQDTQTQSTSLVENTPITTKPVKPVSVPSRGFSSSSPQKTRILVKYNVGFPNTVSIRGNGGLLSWEEGIPLTNVREDEWLWETTIPFEQLEFKVLINDQVFEKGNNHFIQYGASIQYTPDF